MKIKLAILEKDKNYLFRLVTSFNSKYSDKLEIYSFTDKDIAMNTLENGKINVFIADYSFDIDVSQIPSRCGFAYFVDSSDVETIKGEHAIGKYQKSDLIYKQILSIFSEKSGTISGLKLGDESTKICVFCSVAGGAGTSTLAAAAAIHFASTGKKTLYLNLENFGNSDLFFSGEGQFDMSDVIFAVKSKKTNLALKLESCVKQDQSGVDFYSAPKNALDMKEFSFAEKVELISELKILSSYDYIIVDMQFSLEKKVLNVLKEASSIVWVSDGSEIANSKIESAYKALNLIEQSEDIQICGKICLAYNKFSNKSGTAVKGVSLKNIGGAQRYEHATTKQILDQLKNKEIFNQIF